MAHAAVLVLLDRWYNRNGIGSVQCVELMGIFIMFMKLATTMNNAGILWCIAGSCGGYCFTGCKFNQSVQAAPPL